MAGRKAGQGSNWIRRTRRTALYRRDSYACVYCGRSAIDGMVLTLDHVLPCELGGDNANGNLVTACLSCNSAKQDLTLREFAAYLADTGLDPRGTVRRVRNALRRKVTKGSED